MGNAPTDRRITKQTERILATLLLDPSADWWGAQIAPAAGLKSGTIYPALARLERFGWLTSRWEDIEPSEQGRPRRRLYRLTGDGERAAQQIVRRATARARRGTPRPVWQASTAGGQP